MRALSLLLLALSIPAAAAAQSTVADGMADSPAAPPMLVDQWLRAPTTGSTGRLQSMPLWSTPDGRVLAIVAMADDTIPSKPQVPQVGSAADWKFVDVTNFVTSGLLLNLNRDNAAYATIGRGAIVGPAYSPALLNCAPLSPAAASSACAGRIELAQTGTVQFGTDWTILDNLDLDLSYGLSWLHRDSAGLGGAAAPRLDFFAALANPQFPTLMIPGFEGASVQNSGLGALGHWRLGEPGSIDFGASLTHLQLYAPNTPPLTSLNQAAVTFGLRHGAFSGIVTGRVLGPADSFNTGSRWAGLDIGFSWRTPWQGELVFGTQNLWSSGSLPNLTDPGSREVDANQARVPYVQYHQDL